MSSAYNSRGGMQFQSNQTIHPGQLNASMKQASRGAATPSTFHFIFLRFPFKWISYECSKPNMIYESIS
jgi:hypothetical protein